MIQRTERYKISEYNSMVTYKVVTWTFLWIPILIHETRI